MKLRTSYFNGTVLRKDITRFAPVWALYTIFMLLVFVALEIEKPQEMVSALRDTLTGMSGLNILYAGIAAAMLFGDLFQSRMCNTLHTFPMRREGWFFTHLTAGILFCLVPNLLIVILASFTLKSLFYIGFVWLAVTLLQYLFFFGIATLSALCAGSRLGMAAVYCLINFLSWLVYYLAEIFYIPLLHGIEADLSIFSFFSPVVHMSGHKYFEFIPYTGDFQSFIPEDWSYLLTVAAIGLGALALALLAYRRRHLERASDFISVAFLRPVFLVIATVGAGAVMHAFGTLFSEDVQYLFAIAGLAIGFFAGRMLLMRTVKVFHPKAFGAFVLIVAALGLSMGLTRLDPLGITTYVPDAQQVEKVTLRTTSGTNYKYYGGPIVTLTEESDIAEILELHQTLTTQEDAESKAVDLYMEYTLKAGNTVRRYYRVAADTDQGQLLNKFFSSWQCVFRADNWESFKNSIQKIYVEHPYTLFTPDKWDELLAAMYKDCLEGNLAQEWVFHQNEEHKGWVEIAVLNQASQGHYLSINIYESCTNTIAVLEKYAVVEE